MGDVPSLAAALAQQASPGRIVVSAATAPLIQEVARLEEAPHVFLATPTTPITVYDAQVRDVEPTPQEPRRARPRSHFVNRQAELAALCAGLERAVDGQGQVIGIVGEPGIGKSRLLEELRQQAAEQSIAYLSGACQSYRRATPYLPLLALLRQRCGLHTTDDATACRTKIHGHLLQLGAEPGEWVPLLLHLLGVADATEPIYELSPQAYRTHVFTALHHLFLGMSKQQPLVIVVENLHWIDPTTEAYLATFVERLPGAKVLLLVTYRPGYQPPWLTTSTAMQIALLSLASHDSQRLVQGVDTTRRLSEAALRQIVTYANGNPLFLEELARAVDEQEAEFPILAVPETVQTVLAARIDRLSAEVKQLLQTAAVIGHDIPLSLLQTLSPFPEEVLAQHLHHLQVSEFLYETHLPPDIAYTFKHVLIQEVAYQSLLRPTRQQIHAQIAEFLAEHHPNTVETQPEIVAHHFTEAGRHALAIPCWQRAGQRAIERSAHREAISHLSKGLDLLQALPSTPERSQQELQMQLALGPALLAIKGHTSPEVEHAYTRAYDISQQHEETPQHFSVLVGLWRLYLNRAQLRTTRELAEQCFALAQRLQDPMLRQEAHLILGSTWNGLKLSQLLS